MKGDMVNAGKPKQLQKLRIIQSVNVERITPSILLTLYDVLNYYLPVPSSAKEGNDCKSAVRKVFHFL